jgi:gamma-glutamylcyclotransferase
MTRPATFPCHYFAYGSNMWPPKLAQWGIQAVYVARACLGDWEFRMNKRGKDGFARANIEPRSGHQVWGVLYLVDADGIQKLDRMEGLGRGYRAELLPVLAEAKSYQAYTYIGINLAEGLPITRAYSDMILQGAVHHQLAAEYCDWLRQQLAAAG